MELIEIATLVLWYALGIFIGSIFGGIFLTMLVLVILDWFPDLKLYLLNGDISGYLALAIAIMVVCAQIGAGIGVYVTYLILQNVESRQPSRSLAASTSRASPLLK